MAYIKKSITYVMVWLNNNEIIMRAHLYMYSQNAI